MVEVRESGRKGRAGGSDEEVVVGSVVVDAEALRTDADVAPAPATSHGFGGDGLDIVRIYV